MLKRIDIEEPKQRITGYSYISRTNLVESVQLVSPHYVRISTSGGISEVDIYTEDIPKLIKALQAAQDHKE